MSKIPQKQRKQIFDSVQSKFVDISSLNTTVGKKWFKDLEDYFFTLIVDINPDLYFQSLFHVYILALQLGKHILKYPFEDLLPSNASRISLRTSPAEKDCPALVPLEYKDIKQEKYQEECPSVAEALGVTELESMIECGRCLPLKPQVDWIEMQIRGADEPATIFAHCTKCHTRWRK